MQYEDFHGVQVPKMGYGTWKIGGEQTADPTRDAESMLALRSALSLGYRHFDTAEFYAAGHSEELLGQAIREFVVEGHPRQELFITSKVSPEHLDYDAVLRSHENSLKRLGLPYIDLYLIHWPRQGMYLPDTFRALNRLVSEGLVRHLGVSNFNLKQLKESVQLSQTPLLTNQVSYSIPDRTYVENGVLEYCQQNGILLTAYSPVKRRSIRSNQLLAQISRTHNATPLQIALAWLVAQPRVITIPMSLNPQHQAQNLAALQIQLTPQEMDALNRAYGSDG